MFIAHLPAGYLAARMAGNRALFWGILLGSILPDVDLLWFLFVDGGQVHHHTYLTHRPAIWASLLLLGAVLRSKGLLGIGLGSLLHMFLDSVTGAIAWAWPVSAEAHPFVIVPATRDWWVMSFLTHWTFLIEIAICLAALVSLGLRRPSRFRRPPQT